VANVAVGKRVAYILGPIGSYARGRLYPAKRLLRLPDNVSAEDAATVLFKGITAHYLLHSTYAVGPGTVVLLGSPETVCLQNRGAFNGGFIDRCASPAR
jgi:NADPH2:quinone reductase